MSQHGPWEEDDDYDEEEFLAAWDAVDRQSAAALREMLADVLAEPTPQPDLAAAASELRDGLPDASPEHAYVAAACGWQQTPDLDDEELWLQAAAATISPPDDPRVPAEELSAAMALEHTDWLTLVAGLVIRGEGTPLDVDTLLDDLAPEVDDAVEAVSDGDVTLLGQALLLVEPLWRRLGALDDDGALTSLGRWGLPRALHRAWVGADPDEAPVEVGPRLSESQAQAALEALRERPMTWEELLHEVRAQGIETDLETLRRSLVWRIEVFEDYAGRQVHLPSLVEGVTLTHRVSEAELAAGVLIADLDLDLVGLLCLDGAPVRGGGEVQTKFRHEAELPDDASSALLVPEGTLAGFAAGELVAVRLADGLIDVTPVADAPETDDPRCQQLVEVAWQAARSDALHGDPEAPGASGTDIVVEALLQHPGLLDTPLPPLRELLTGTGLEVNRGYVGLPGTAWEGEPSYLTDGQREALRHWRTLVSSYLTTEEVPDTPQLADLSARLTGVADFLAAEMVSRPEVDPLLEAWANSVPARASALPLYLRSRVAEGRGDATQWQRLLDAAAARSDLPGVLEDSAYLHWVSGEIRAAARLYEAAGYDGDDAELRALLPLLAPPSSATGRNQPCPCGSGKKYKVCHGRHAGHPLPVRADALWAKLSAFLQRAPQRGELLDWAQRFSGVGRDSMDTIRLAMRDDFVHDTVLFDGGAAQRFLDVLGPLVPDDEVELLRQWMTMGRRLLEVRRVRGAELTMRDVLIDDEVEVSCALDVDRLRDGAVLYGRPLPDGAGGHRFFSAPLVVESAEVAPLAQLLRDHAPLDDVIEGLYV